MTRLLLIALLLTGCTGLPLQNRESASVLKGVVTAKEDTRFEKITEGDPTPVNTTTVTPSVTVSGHSNRVDVKIEAPEPLPALPLPAGYKQTVRAGQATSDTATVAESASLSVRLPISVAILIGAVGLGLLLLVWRSATKSSAALGGFAEVVDNYFAAEIRKHRSIATTATDSAEIARHLAAVGELEANRGRITL